MRFRLPWRWIYLLSLVLLIGNASRAFSETVPLRRAIELALAHSTGSVGSAADVQRAFASYRELRNGYIPQLMVGSGLGWSYGIPLTIEGSAPSLFDVTAQSSVFNPSLKQFTNSARTEWMAAQFQSKDQRAATIQDVVLSYAELAKWEARLTRLSQDEGDSLQMEKSVTDRVAEGIDSALDLNRAKLNTARIRWHMAEARGSSEVLRHHLSKLTGLPISSIEIAPETVPAMPELNREEDLPSKALAASPAIKAADQHALAELFKARGEHRALLPSFDFAAHYARLATFNNYDQFYLRFRPDAATVGISIRFPLFNESQRARARAADAEATKAKAQAEATKNQVSEETLKLQRASDQLAAAREVANLEYQVALSSLDAVQTRLDAGTANFHDLGEARIQASERFLAAQDAEFEYQRARLSLMRATGDLEAWALPGTSSK